MVVTDRDLGYREILQRLAGVRDSATRVGIHEDAESDLAVIAATNEYGSEDGRVPERSFLRATADANAAAYTDALTEAVDAHNMGRTPLKKGLARLGARVEGDIKAFMTDLQDPPNAPSTIARKGSSNPLIDTGRLRGAIAHKEDGG